MKLAKCAQELARQNPRLVAQINENQAEFLQLLNEPGAPGMNDMASELANQLAAANEGTQGGNLLFRVDCYWSVMISGNGQSVGRVACIAP